MDIAGKVEVSRSPSFEEQHRAERKEDSAHQGKNYVVSLITLVSIIIYAFLTFLMYCATKDSADAAKSAADSTRQALIASNRAWIEITLAPPWGDLTRDQAREKLEFISLPLQFKNIGRTPAKQFCIVSTIEIVGKNEVPSLAYNVGTITNTTTPIIYPDRSDTVDVTAKKSDNITTEPTLPPLKKEFELGTKYIILHARGNYSDKFGPHWFRFCKWVSLSKVENSYYDKNCSDYNDAGDGDGESCPVTK